MGRSLDRSADPAQFFRVKPDRPVAERFIQNISAIPDANERAVTVRFVVSVVGGNETSRAGHVVNYELGIAGNMFPHMARNRARVGIVAPARRVTDADANRLTREEIVGHGRTPGHRQKKEIQREYAAVNWLSHIGSPHFCLRTRKARLSLALGRIERICSTSLSTSSPETNSISSCDFFAPGRHAEQREASAF